jgi:hypothetical protein
MSNAPEPTEPAKAHERWIRELERVLADDSLRLTFRKWIESPQRSSVWERICSNTLLHIFLGFFLTGVIGTILTNHYATTQKEVERARSFADKLNDARVNRIMEVWEKLCLHEAAATRFVEDSIEIERIQNQPLQPSKGDPEAQALADRTKRDMSGFVALAQEVRDLSDKNRIWLGEATYQKIRTYLDETNALTRDSLKDSQKLTASRNRTTLAQIRELVFKE